MNRSVAILLAVTATATAVGAEPPGGKPQADGSTLYESKFGTVTAKPDGTVLLTLPKSKHAASMMLKNFRLDVVNSKPGGVMFMTDATDRGFVASAFYEKAEAGSAVECREFYFTYALKSPAPKKDVTRSETKNLAIGSYVTTELGGTKLDQYHRNVYAFADGYCLDLHISKVFFDPATEGEALDAVTSSVVMIEK